MSYLGTLNPGGFIALSSKWRDQNGKDETNTKSGGF